jgi:ABC-type transport system substrate-binding protein
VRRPRRAHPLAVVLLLALLAHACAREDAPSPSGPSDGPPGTSGPVVERPATTIRVGLGRDPFSIDPRTLGDDEGELVVRALFDGLVDVSPDGAVVPAAARWTVEDDGLTYRFLLREDRFHDGSPVTAEHHADALLAVLDPERAPRFREELLLTVRGATAPMSDASGDATDVAPDGTGDGADAEAPSDPSRVPGSTAPAEGLRWGLPDEVLRAGGIEVLGPRELLIRLERPDPRFLFRLADPALVPLPRLAVDDPARFALQPIGNGPFRMVGPREPGAFIRLAASPDHPRPPGVDSLVLQVYDGDVDRSQRWDDLTAGRLQITAVPTARRDDAVERYGRPVLPGSGPGLHDAPLASLYAYGFVLDVAPYDDLDLRRAISAAIDRDALALALAPASVEAATSILPPSVPGSAQLCAHCRRDVDLAREAVERWRGRLPEGSGEPRIVLHYPRGAAHVTIAERVAADLEDVLDLEVRLQARDFGTLVRAVVAGEAGLFRYGLRPELGGRAAALSLLDPHFRTGSPAGWVRWPDEATDAVLDAWTPVTPPERLRDVEAAVLEAAAVVPLLWTRADLVVHPDVAGFRMDATGRWWPELVRVR